jgi:hypothetical protein
VLALTGKRAADVAHAGAGLTGRDLSKVLSAPGLATANTVRPAALFNYNMFSYLDASWFAPMIQVVNSKESTVDRAARLVQLQPDFRNRGAIRSIFDGRYRFSRYFAPLEFNRPTTYEALIAKSELEIYDLGEDPQETRNLALDGKATAELAVGLSEKLNRRIDEEVGVDDGKFLPLLHGYWYPTRI